MAATKTSYMLTLSGVSKSYRGNPARTVLCNIDFELGAGEYVAIMGESGVGKSTLLNLIAGLDRADSGTIQFNGAQLGALDDEAATLLRRREMGFVFQAFHVLPHLDVAQNVALPLLLNGVARRVAQQRVTSMLAAVGLDDRQDSMPRELSGGEMQRVAIARALIHEPKLVLADEPTGNLDAGSKSHVLELLRSQIERTGAAGILVTHSSQAAQSADRVLLLTPGGLAMHAPCALGRT